MRRLPPLILLFAAAPVAAAPPPEGAEFFEKQVRPILVERCYPCHSDAAPKPKGGLRLDSRDGALKGGHSGPAVVPGKPDESPLLDAIARVGDVQPMPPDTIGMPTIKPTRKYRRCSRTGRMTWVACPFTMRWGNRAVSKTTLMSTCGLGRSRFETTSEMYWPVSSSAMTTRRRVSGSIENTASPTVPLMGY